MLDLESSSCESSSDSVENTFSSSDDDILPNDWTSNGKERSLFSFHSDYGVKFSVSNRDNPVEYFENYFDAEVITFLFIETNRFAKQFQAEKKDQLLSQSQIHK